MEILAEIRVDEGLRWIPIVVLSASQAEQDIVKVYHLNTNRYVTKPVDLDKFFDVLRSIEGFWLTIVKPPPA